MGREGAPRCYTSGISPTLAARDYKDPLRVVEGTTALGIVDPQGRKNKKCNISDSCPTLRAQTHGNPPCAVLKLDEEISINSSKTLDKSKEI